MLKKQAGADAENTSGTARKKERVWGPKGPQGVPSVFFPCFSTSIFSIGPSQFFGHLASASFDYFSGHY